MIEKEEKTEVELASIDPELDKAVREFSTNDMLEAIQIKDKLEKYARIDEVKEEAINHFNEIYADSEELDSILKTVKKIVDMIEGEEVRKLITEDKIRPDGRKMDEIRPLSARID